MRLYEFNYIDNQKLPQNKLLKRVEEFLLKECELQDWEPGYKIHECQKVEQLPSGGLKYTFEVLGKYSDTVNEGEDSSSQEESNKELYNQVAKDITL